MKDRSAQIPHRSNVYPLLTVDVRNLTRGLRYSVYRQTQAQANRLVTIYSEAYPRDDEYLIVVRDDARRTAGNPAEPSL